MKVTRVREGEKEEANWSERERGDPFAVGRFHSPSDPFLFPFEPSKPLTKP